MTNASILKTSVTTGVALTALVLVLQRDMRSAPTDPLDAAIAHQRSRVEAAHASLEARPLIGPSHLPSYDAPAAIAREEAELRRLSAQRSAAR